MNRKKYMKKRWATVKSLGFTHLVQATKLINDNEAKWSFCPHCGKELK